MPRLRARGWRERATFQKVQYFIVKETFWTETGKTVPFRTHLLIFQHKTKANISVDMWY